MSPVGIVILEDNLADRLMIEQAIHEAGLECTFAAFGDGTKATQYITAAATPVPALVILDLNLPGVESPSVLNRLRGNPRWSHVPVVVFTASASPSDRARMALLGSDHYIVKPSNLAGFRAFGQMVKRWVDERRGEPVNGSIRDHS